MDVCETTEKSLLKAHDESRMIKGKRALHPGIVT